jgi:pimeloyl-ACP methyl ester carboxylesterase
MSDSPAAPTHSHPLSAADHRARGAGGAVRALEAVSTAAAARLAEAIFCKTVRPPARPDEAVFLARAERGQVRALGLRIATYRWGDPSRPRVLLTHGWWSHAGRWVAIAGALERRGFSVVAFDAPGHGRSGGWRASMPEFAWTLRAVTEQVGPLHAAVGHSLGGAATIFAMSRGLPADRAVTLAAPADIPRWADRFRDALALSPAVDARMRRNLEARIGLEFEDLHLTAVAARLPQPGLVIHDTEDGDVPVHEAEALAGSWADAELHVTSGLGHRKLLRDPAVIERVVGFLDDRR